MRNLKVLFLKPMQGCEVGDVFFPSEYFTKIYRCRDYGSYVIVYRDKVNVLK